MTNYHFNGEENIPSPALIYHRDLIAENTKMAISCAKSASFLWPHVKSHKTSALTQSQTTVGIYNFKCATIAETEMVAQTDAKNILLAYPLVGPNIQRFIALIKKYPGKTFYALGDSYYQLEELSRQAVIANLQIKCIIDVNTGMNRTGVSFHELHNFYKTASSLSGLSLSGLHCYDGNRHEKDITERADMVNKTISQILIAKKNLVNDGLPCPVIIAGGTPSFPCYAKNLENVYYSPGTVFLFDSGYKEQFPDLPYIPAATILTRVISHPAKGYFTLDSGYKALSSEQGICGVIPELQHANQIFQSEEHWTFQMEHGHEEDLPPIGTIFHIIPWHICPTSVLYEKAYIISNKQLCDEWEITARNRSIGC